MVVVQKDVVGIKGEKVTLDEFLVFLFGDEEGYVYAPYKLSTGAFHKDWYKYPEDRDSGVMDYHLVNQSTHSDQYMSPVLFNSKDTKDFKLSNVVWCDFDEGIPDELGDFPRSSIRVSSSNNSQKEHWYWKLSEPCRSHGDLERYNKQLAYALGADKGCWNFNRVLRPIETLNYKYTPPASVSLVETTETVLDTYVLDMLPKVSETLSEPLTWTPVPMMNLPRLNQKTMEFWLTEKDEGVRSQALTSLAISCVEQGLTIDQTMTYIEDADRRWGKFVGRADREQRLQAIVGYAQNITRQTSNTQAEEEQRDGKTLLNRGTDRSVSEGPQPLNKFIAHKFNVDWVIYGLLHSQGLAIIASPPGVGKTQFSTNLLLSIGCGKTFLDWVVTRPRKVLFLSLEMTQPELKQYIDKMLLDFSEEERDLLNQNVYFVSRQAFRLNSEKNQQTLLEWLDEIGPEGLFIDSLSRCVGGDLEKGEIDAVFDFLNKEVRDKRGCFLWFVHHNRKANFNQKQPKKLEDLYGSQYIGAYASSVIGLWKIDDNELEVNCLKIWFTKPFPTFRMSRTNNLTFQKRREILGWQ